MPNKIVIKLLHRHPDTKKIITSVENEYQLYIKSDMEEICNIHNIDKKN